MNIDIDVIEKILMLKGKWSLSSWPRRLFASVDRGRLRAAVSIRRKQNKSWRYPIWRLESGAICNSLYTGR